MNVNKVLVFAGTAGSVGYLCSAAAKYGKETTLILNGGEADAKGAAKAYLIKGGSVVQYIPAVMKLLESIDPELILTDASNDGKLMAGIFAAKCKAAILCDAVELSGEDHLLSSRMVYGGAAFKREKVLSAKTVVCMGPGLVEEAELPVCGTVETLGADGAVKYVGKDVKLAKAVNLAAAKKLVAVGRGAAKVELLEQIARFAASIEAEVGCTRPIAEEEKLMPKETYIGVSGVMCKPATYIGIGISGQVQHMVGVNSANTIIAINKDKNAPIFQQCDYGLVADINEALPLICDDLK